MSTIFVLVLSVLLISGIAYIHCIISFLMFCVSASCVLVNISVWNSYFVILIYVGGILIIIIYFASLSSWFLFINQTFWMFFSGSLLLFEISNSELFSSSSAFYFSSSVELVWSLLILSLICILASQLLLSGSTLRSINN